MLTLITKIMSSKLQSQEDRKFFLFLTRLYDRFATENAEIQLWWEDWQQVKQYYETKKIGAIADDRETENQSRDRAIRTELHRGMKLLEMDLIFFRSAKQETTKQQRQKAIVSRLEQLRGYGEIILGDRGGLM
jgi:hypothetical protein